MILYNIKDLEKYGRHAVNPVEQYFYMKETYRAYEYISNPTYLTKIMYAKSCETAYRVITDKSVMAAHINSFPDNLAYIGINELETKDIIKLIKKNKIDVFILKSIISMKGISREIQYTILQDRPYLVKYIEKKTIKMEKIVIERNIKEIQHFESLSIPTIKYILTKTNELYLLNYIPDDCLEELELTYHNIYTISINKIQVGPLIYDNIINAITDKGTLKLFQASQTLI